LNENPERVPLKELFEVWLLRENVEQGESFGYELLNVAVHQKSFNLCHLGQLDESLSQVHQEGLSTLTVRVLLTEDLFWLILPQELPNDFVSLKCF
jgi:hypothetical protein